MNNNMDRVAPLRRSVVVVRVVFNLPTCTMNVLDWKL